jgi:hypothetical protein
MLLNGSCAVRLQPLVWQCVRSARLFGSGSADLLQHLRPEQATRPHLGHFHEEVHADAPEEAETVGELIHLHASGDARAHVLDAVRQRVSELQIRRRAGLVHVVAADADAVELGHLLRAIAEDVAHDAHAGTWRVDVGVAHHELLQDVVLDGALQLLRRLRLVLPRPR